MEDHGHPPVKPPWTKTTNLPTAIPQESEHESSKSKHQQDINTSKTNNTPQTRNNNKTTRKKNQTQPTYVSLPDHQKLMTQMPMA
eukprot:11768475-Ditylum_brightwellii.AAC.1